MDMTGTSSSTGGSHTRPLSQRILLWTAVVLLIFGTVFGLQATGAFASSLSQALLPAPYPVQCVPGTVDAAGNLQISCSGLTPVTTTVTVTDTVTVTAPAPTTPPATTPATTTPPTSTPPTTPPATTPAPTTPAPSTTAPADACMPKPSACGWPDASNTGVPKGTVLTTWSGDRTVTVAGTVINGLNITGCLIINANNVTVRNSRIGTGGGCSDYVVRSFNRTGTLIEDTEIVLGGNETKGIAFDGYTARRVWFHGGSDCAHMGLNVLIEDSFCDIPAGGPADGPHYDGFQSDGGRNIVIRHNTIRVPYSQTSAILMSTNTSPITDVTIVNNLVAGGGYAIYCGTDSGGDVRGTLTFFGNVIAKTYFSRGGYWGPTTHCPATGWRWDA